MSTPAFSLKATSVRSDPQRRFFLPFNRCDPIDPGPRETQHAGGTGGGDGEMCGGPGSGRGRVPDHHQVFPHRPSLLPCYSHWWVTDGDTRTGPRATRTEDLTRSWTGVIKSLERKTWPVGNEYPISCSVKKLTHLKCLAIAKNFNRSAFLGQVFFPLLSKV